MVRIAFYFLLSIVAWSDSSKSSKSNFSYLMGNEHAHIKKSAFDPKAQWYGIYENKIALVKMYARPIELDVGEYVSVSPPEDDFGIKYVFAGIEEIKIEPATFKAGKLKTDLCEKKVALVKSKPISDENYKCEKSKKVFAIDGKDVTFYSYRVTPDREKWRVEMSYLGKKYDLGTYSHMGVNVDFVGDLNHDNHPDAIVTAWEGKESCVLSFNTLLMFDNGKMKKVGFGESGGCM